MAGKLVRALKGAIFAVAVDIRPDSTPAKRPKYSVLSNQKLFDAFGIVRPNWRESLAKTLS